MLEQDIPNIIDWYILAGFRILNKQADWLIALMHCIFDAIAPIHLQL